MAAFRGRASVGLGLIVGVVAVVVETAICRSLLDHRLPDIMMVYLLGIVLLAVRVGYSASLPATVLSVVAVDFFFTGPIFPAWTLPTSAFLLTFVLMALVASVISSQTERIRRREEEDGHPVRHESRAHGGEFGRGRQPLPHLRRLPTRRDEETSATELATVSLRLHGPGHLGDQ